MNDLLKIRYPAFFLIANLVLTIASSPSYAQTQSICYPVANASFEQWDTRKPINWTTSSWGGSQADYVPSTPGFNSDYAGQIAMQPYMPGTDAKLRSDNIAVSGNQLITLGLFARGNASTVELQVVQYDNNNQVVDYTWLGSVRLGDNAAQWQEHAKQFHSTPNTSYVQLEILVKSAGTLYIDNIWAGSGASSNSCSGQSTTTQTIDVGNGFIFSRTDTTEYRWIATHQSGGVGSVWISESCAKHFDVPTVRGDWIDLISLAPHFDSIQSPCGSNSDNNSRIDTSVTGYVFSRSDKNEFRWIDLNSSGVYGSRWINQECARRLGGASAIGDWFELINLAPAFDGVRTPC